MIHMIIPALLFMQVPTAQDFAEALKTAGARDILELPDGITVVEEKTLPKDSLKSNPSGSSGSAAGPVMSDLGERGERGMRLIAITLQPSEKLVVKLSTLDSNKLQLGIATPTKPGPMTDQIILANRRIVAIKGRSMEIRNSLDQPFAVVVRVIGNLGYAYKLEFLRSK